MVSKKRGYRSSSFAKKKRILFYTKVLIGVLIVILLFWGVGYFSGHKSHRVEEIIVNGEVFANEDEIKKVVNGEIRGKYLFLISKNSSLFIPRNKIQRKILNNYIFIKDADVSFGGLHSIQIDIDEYSPYAKWCGDKCYLINREGYLFMENSDHFIDNLIIFYDFIEGEPLGNTYISKDKFKEITSFIEDLKKININITSVKKDLEFQTLIFETDTGIIIYADQNDDLRKSIFNLTKAIEQDGLNEAQLSNIEYINLRVDDQVIYRLR